MKIPIRNLYYLFLYAWARFPTANIANVGVDNAPDVQHLLAKLLVQGSRRLIRRGLDRRYVDITEETATPRGKLRVDRITKEMTHLRGRVVCDIDDLSHDVIHNQILKATISTFIRDSEIKSEVKHELASVLSHLRSVSDIRLTAFHFGRVQLASNAIIYGFLMRICAFSYFAKMPDQQGRSGRFQDILEDEVRMSTVFEEFLKNFYMWEQEIFSVSSPILTWDSRTTSSDAHRLLPTMRTDIVLEDASRVIVIDAKFYKKTLATTQFGERVRSDHLYQLSIYLQHLRIKHSAQSVSGILIYPLVDRPLHLNYELLGFPISVLTIDLAADWKSIHSNLLNLIVSPGALKAGSPNENKQDIYSQVG